MGVDFGHCLNKHQNKCSKSKTEFFEQFTDFYVSVINHIRLTITKQIMPNKLSKYGAAQQTITNMYEQCRSSPTLGSPKCLHVST